MIFLAGHALSQDWALGRYLLCAAGLYGLSVAASVITANRFEPICGAWLEEYGSYALVLGFSAQMVRRGVLLTRENDLLTQHLQEEVDRKTQGINVLLRERRELLANLLHDLKNPLSALRSYAELVRSGNVSLDSETSEYRPAPCRGALGMCETDEAPSFSDRRFFPLPQDGAGLPAWAAV